MNKPLVSVILPHFNHLDFLESRIRNILDQTFGDLELIVLDDATPGFSSNLLPRDERVAAIVINQRNSGSPFVQWSRGLELCKGDYVWIAESDDVAVPFFLEKAVGAMEGHILSSFFFCESYRLSSQGLVLPAPTISSLLADIEPDSNGLKAARGGALRAVLTDTNMILNVSSCLFRTFYLKEIREAIESFRYLGDWFTYLTLSKNASFVFDPMLANYQRTSTSNISFSDFSNEKAIRMMQEYKRIFNLQLELGFIGYTNSIEKKARTQQQLLKYANLESRLRSSLPLHDDYYFSIFGAGAYGRQVLRVLTGLKVKTFRVIDRIASEASTADGFENVPLVSLEKFSRLPRFGKHKIIIASVAFEDEIRAELDLWGLGHLIFKH